MDYSKTLNLPVTDFPMRGNLPEREPEILDFWRTNDVYKQVLKKNKSKPTFILHDGPPYANGDIHLGHTLNKVIKDIVVKYRSMSGYNAPYVPGWDTHGLPIEQRAIKALGLNRHSVSPVEFRQKCKEFALKYVDIQREQFKRLGVTGDWDNPYLTLQPHFEAKQIEVFGEMAKKGYIYKGLKPVYWCASCETALAEAEVEYAEKTSHSIYVKFAVKDGKGVLANDVKVVIWTTTPWTLPANVAISVHPDFDYVVLAVNGEKLLVAKELAETFASLLEVDYNVLQTVKGQELEHITCQHPFMERESLVILGEHVTLEQGTGCVHTAPGHGVDDFLVGTKYNLPVISPMDNSGKFTAEAGSFAGQKYHEANESIVSHLQEIGALVQGGKIKHQYPHCWRCKNPILFRATEQWFASIDGFRKQALEEIDKTQWIPKWGHDRIYNMIADRGDWCISRQRTWGVPIPIFYCEKCNKEIINDATISKIMALFKEHGSDIWFAKDAKDLVPEGLSCPECGHGEFRKETDIMDVWFDSGSSHNAVLNNPDYWPELSWPADLYLEGSDQHRGWFNSSLSTAVATRGEAPYKAVLTHGFLVDDKGRKMSKSLGNGVDPLEVINSMGADILRLWVSSADYKSDVAVSPGILKQIAESYRKIRNTARYLLGSIADYDNDKHRVAYDDLQELDQWALMKLHKLIDRVLNGYETYEFHVVYHSVHNFCAVDMSAYYFDIIKDRLYTSLADAPERRAAQTVLYDIAHALVRLVAPILTYTAEEIWRYLPGKGEQALSVQLADMPEVNRAYMREDLEQKWARIGEMRKEVAKVLESARREKVIGHSLGAKVTLFASGDTYNFLQASAADLATILIVSQVEVKEGQPTVEATRAETVEGLFIKVEPSSGDKCERCWMHSASVGHDSEHTNLCTRCATVVKQMDLAAIID